jgi:Nucleotidyl transferase AbiEii toxin, Type IV TA system/WYL domain
VTVADTNRHVMPLQWHANGTPAATLAAQRWVLADPCRSDVRSRPASPNGRGVPRVAASDEALTQRAILRPIGHPYSDRPLPVNGVLCYPIDELFGEKLRALSERCRPRDLYDVVHLYRHPDLLGRASAVARVLRRKCEHAGIDIPTLETIRATPFRQEIESEWTNMLGHQLPQPLPPFASFWNTLDEVFGWLSGTRTSIQLPRAQFADVDPSWRPPTAMTSWRRGVPLELLRYAGANRLRVDIDYRAEKGRSGPRRVEPYALRRTRDGNLVLFVRNDRGQLRSYRVDRIASIRPTAESFTPRYRVEF